VVREFGHVRFRVVRIEPFERFADLSMQLDPMPGG
jgi:hypothetical protein